MPRSALSLIATGKRGITADTALKFAEVFGTSPQFLMSLQAAVDLWDADRRKRPNEARKRGSVPVTS